MHARNPAELLHANMVPPALSLLLTHAVLVRVAFGMWLQRAYLYLRKLNADMSINVI